jgi:glycosyltransferase involved in cell wall biosynthesis
MLVSIVIPSYNVEQWVADALDAALQQQYSPIEIIVVDNNSRDKTLSIIKDYENRFPGLISVFTEPKQGACAARNCGLQHAKGGWIQFLDADDLIGPDKIKKQVELVSGKENIAYVAGGLIARRQDGTEVSITPMEDNVLGLMEGLRGGMTSANLWSKAALEAVRGWKENQLDGQDIELMMRLIQAGYKAVPDSNQNTIKRSRPEGQITTMAPQRHLMTHITLRKNFIAFLKARTPEYYQANQQFLYAATFRYIRMLGGIDATMAITVFDEVMPKGFRLQAIKDLRMGPVYVALFNIFGYNTLERIKGVGKKCVPFRLFRHYLRRMLHSR